MSPESQILASTKMLSDEGFRQTILQRMEESNKKKDKDKKANDKAAEAAAAWQIALDAIHLNQKILQAQQLQAARSTDEKPTSTHANFRAAEAVKNVDTAKELTKQAERVKIAALEVKLAEIEGQIETLDKDFISSFNELKRYCIKDAETEQFERDLEVYEAELLQQTQTQAPKAEPRPVTPDDFSHISSDAKNLTIYGAIPDVTQTKLQEKREETDELIARIKALYQQLTKEREEFLRQINKKAEEAEKLAKERNEAIGNRKSVAKELNTIKKTANISETKYLPFDGDVMSLISKFKQATYQNLQYRPIEQAPSETADQTYGIRFILVRTSPAPGANRRKAQEENESQAYASYKK